MIVAAAIRTHDGVIHFIPRPGRHHHILHKLYAAGITKDREQGFITADGQFVTRIEGAAIAGVTLNHPPLLYSEDLW